MLSSTKDMLSLALYLADATYCTICVIVQDGIDLIAQVLGKQSSSCIAKQLAITLPNIALRDIAFVISKSCHLAGGEASY